VPDANRVNRPVNYVSFWDACRFANWLHNGQPTGAQDPTTTEDGAYTLTAEGMADNSIARNDDANVWVPSEDEWYKAAYYKGGGTEAGYWYYATESDGAPTAEPPPGTNPAYGSSNSTGDSPGAVGDLTDVGAYNANDGNGEFYSDSAYGTFDQNGNVWEWNEAILLYHYDRYVPDPDRPWYRSTRGGSFNYAGGRAASDRGIDYYWPEAEFLSLGFRVASVPEPATLSLLALGGLAVIRRRRKTRLNG